MYCNIKYDHLFVLVPFSLYCDYEECTWYVCTYMFLILTPFPIASCVLRSEEESGVSRNMYLWDSTYLFRSFICPYRGLTCMRGSVSQSEGILIPRLSVRVRLKSEHSNLYGFGHQEITIVYICRIRMRIYVIKSLNDIYMSNNF